MDNFDFTICEFIEREMWFVTYDDFCDRRVGLKRLFDGLTYHQQLFYKWYVYSNIHMKETFKNAIWDYLNGFDLGGAVLMQKKKFYKAR